MKNLLLDRNIAGIAKSVLLGCTLFIGHFVVAQSNITTQQYIELYKSMAIDEMDRSGIPASITLAQGILESSSGNSELARFANNHFGIKCHSGWAGGEYYKKDDDRDHKGQLIKSCFRVYGSAYESYINHTEFLTGKQRYAFLFNYPKEDYISWAKGLKTAGYATNPIYADKLIRVIEENNLSQYDYMTNRHQQVAQHIPPKPVEKAPEPVVVVKEEPVIEAPEPEKSVAQVVENKPSPNDWEPTSFDSMEEIRETGSNQAVFPKQYRSGIFTINQIKVVSSKKGDTPYEVAVRYDVKVKKLLKFNDLKQGVKLIPNQYIFLQSKRSKYREPRTYHRVSDKDNMYIISQLYGIKLNSLKSRNLLEGNEEPAIGEKIYLNGKAKTKPLLRKRTIKRPKSNPRVPKKDIKNFVEEPLAKISESIKPKQTTKPKSKGSSKSKASKNDKRVYDAVTTRTAKSKTKISKEQIELEATEEYTPSSVAKVVNPYYKEEENNKTENKEPAPVKTNPTISNPAPTAQIPAVELPQIKDKPAPVIKEKEIKEPMVNTKPAPVYNAPPAHNQTTIQEPTIVQQPIVEEPVKKEMTTPTQETVEVVSEYYIVVDEDGNIKKVPFGNNNSTVTPSIETSTNTTTQPVEATPYQEQVITQTAPVQNSYETQEQTNNTIIKSQPVIPANTTIAEPSGEPYYVEETSVAEQKQPVQESWEPQENQQVAANNNTSKTHTVQKGDTLYSLSKRYNVNIQTIRDLNGISMNNIKVGQTLRLGY